MFGIFVHYSTSPIYDVSMNLFWWPGFLWQPLLTTVPTIVTVHIFCTCQGDANEMRNTQDTRTGFVSYKSGWF